MKSNAQNEVDFLEQITSGNSIIQTLQLLAERYPKSVTFSTSFSNEDQVITDFVAKSKAEISLFTLDTGRLFEATYSTWNASVAFFGLPISAYYPDPSSLSNYIEHYGPNGFYRSPELRKECCSIRKTAQLKRALTGNRIWITGLRAEHSALRSELPPFEWDELNNVIKYHPLLSWTTDQVSDHVKHNNLPFNPLSEKGFVSLGCEPCTRAISQGEDFRAGRWWWEDSEKKECGLHLQNTPEPEDKSKFKNESKNKKQP